MFVELNIGEPVRKSSLMNNIIKLELLNYFKLNLNDDTIDKWDSYFKNNNYKTDCNKLIRKLIKDIKFNTTLTGNYIVYIDAHNELEKLIKLFNYGNTEIKGSHLISNAFNYLKKNISRILVFKYFRMR